jgi:amino acid permease
MSTVYSPLVAEDNIESDANGISIHEYSSDPAEEAEESIPVYQRAVSKDHEADQLIDQRELSIDGTQVKDPHTAGIFGSYVNLTNSIIGSGCLGLPYAFAGSGWGLGFFLIIISACFTIFSLHLLSICSLKVRAPASFYRITEASVPQLTFLVDLSVATMCFGVGVSYLIVIGGLMPAVTEFLGGSGMWLHREIWIILGFLVVAPISCFKTLDALKWTSALAIFFVVFIAGLVFTYAVDETLARCSDDAVPDHDGCVGGSSSAVVNVNTLRVFGVFVFAYSCQMNIFPVVNELKRPTIKRFNYVILLSIATAVALYCIVAGAGYATYGDAVESNILINYPSEWMPLSPSHHKQTVVCAY